MDGDIDWFAGYKVALENTKRLMTCADNIATVREYGPANSLLILSLEECVKAGFLFVWGIANSAPSNAADIIKMLRQHQFKHYLGYLVQLMLGNAVSMVNDQSVLTRVDNEFRDLDPSDGETIMKRFVEFVSEFTSAAMQKTQSDLSSNMDIGDRNWWREVNLLRNRGFYTDYEGHAWRTPETVSREDFERTKGMVLKLLDEIENYKSPGPKGLSILQQLITITVGQNIDKAGDLPDKL
ncbi:MAG: AbiV family abortive infection protein [Acidobacteriaceae bacterium]